MKQLLSKPFLIVLVLFAAACSKSSTTPPSGAETAAVLLAGAKGASISWKISSISQSKNGAAAQSVTAASGAIPACEADNIFTFSNNTTQTYVNQEGATTCTAGDPSTIESGNWAFTDDGKTLLIDATVNATSAQFSSTAEPFLGYLVLAEGLPLNVTVLNATTLTISYTYVDNTVSPADSYLITLTFSRG